MATIVENKNNRFTDTINRLFSNSSLSGVPKEFSGWGLQSIASNNKIRPASPGRSGVLSSLVTRDTFDFREARNRIVNFLSAGSLPNLMADMGKKMMKLALRLYDGDEKPSLYVKNTGPGGGSVTGKSIDKNITPQSLGIDIKAQETILRRRQMVLKYQSKMVIAREADMGISNHEHLSYVLNALIEKPDVWGKEIGWKVDAQHKVTVTGQNGLTATLVEGRGYIDMAKMESKETRMAREKSGKPHDKARYVGVVAGFCKGTPEETKKYMTQKSAELSNVFGRPISLLTYPNMIPGTPILINDRSLVDISAVDARLTPQVFDKNVGITAEKFWSDKKKAGEIKKSSGFIPPVVNQTPVKAFGSLEKIELVSSNAVYIVCRKGSFEVVSRDDGQRLPVVKLTQLPNGKYDRLTEDQYADVLQKKQDGLKIPTSFGATVILDDKGATHYNIKPDGKKVEHNANTMPSFVPHNEAESSRYALDGEVMEKPAYLEEMRARNQGYANKAEMQLAIAEQRNQATLEQKKASEAPAFGGLVEEYAKKNVR